MFRLIFFLCFCLINSFIVACEIEGVDARKIPSFSVCISSFEKLVNEFNKNGKESRLIPPVLSGLLFKGGFNVKISEIQDTPSKARISILEQHGIVAKEYSFKIEEPLVDEEEDLNLIRDYLKTEFSNLEFIEALAFIRFAGTNCTIYKLADGILLKDVMIDRMRDGSVSYINMMMYSLGSNLRKLHEGFGISFADELVSYGDCFNTKPEIMKVGFVCENTVCIGDFHSSNLFCRSMVDGGKPCFKFQVIDYLSMKRDIRGNGSNLGNDVSYFIFCNLIFHFRFFDKRGVNQDALEMFCGNFLAGYVDSIANRDNFYKNIFHTYVFFLQELGGYRQGTPNIVRRIDQFNKVYENALKILSRKHLYIPPFLKGGVAKATPLFPEGRERKFVGVVPVNSSGSYKNFELFLENFRRTV